MFVIRQVRVDMHSRRGKLECWPTLGGSFILRLCSRCMLRRSCRKGRIGELAARPGQGFVLAPLGRGRFRRLLCRGRLRHSRRSVSIVIPIGPSRSSRGSRCSRRERWEKGRRVMDRAASRSGVRATDRSRYCFDVLLASLIVEILDAPF